jgi:hypothetical protein
MNWLANISFGAPWVLLALIVLPLIWFLLRVTPPLPKRVVFPPLRLLLGLRDEEQTPAGTPWWLMLLRLLAAATVIAALSAPQIGRTLTIAGTGPIVLLVDNGWTAAHDWDARKGLAEEAVRLAADQRRGVVILTTAERPDTSILNSGSAERVARMLSPKPWFASRHEALVTLTKARFATRPEILWLSDGIDDGNAGEVANTLSHLGHLRIFTGKDGPLALTGAANTESGLEPDLLRAGTSGARAGIVTAYGAQGQTLGSSEFHFDDGKNKTVAHIALPLEMRNETTRLAIAGENSAGAVHLFDQGAPRRAIGLVSGSNTSAEEPLLSDLYYLQRALSPYADLHQGTISEALSHGISVLVLADIGKIGGADYDNVAKFVENGGLLIRFAGEHMASGSDDLIPVRLRNGGRYLGGALAWAAPQHLAPFPDDSPLGGLAIPSDVTVSRQILAEPSVELSSHSWARLTDGTPMVTAARHGKGWIVLFHVTAGPGWSSLPMSGLYVGMLRRLLSLSAGNSPSDMAANASLPAAALLDGFGQIVSPTADIQPLRASAIVSTEPSRQHPPGLYGAPGAEVALNAARDDTALLPFGALPVRIEFYASRAALALQSALLLIAMLLLLLDFVLSLALRGYAPRWRSSARGTAAMLGAFLLLHSGQARADDSFALKAALDTRLAYVITGVGDVDAMSKAGLAGLGQALAQRTSYVPLEPMGVNIEKDDLSFFPLLYWPMDPREKDLSPAALSKIADYMRNGGTILIDTRDLTLGAVRGPNSPGQQTLRRLLSKIDLPPLEPVPPNHVLTKTFYLISDFPGRSDGGQVWVQASPSGDSQENSARGGDGVSPVIIGGNDWAAAWAVDGLGRPLVDVSPGGSRQREMAIRFGINVVMYAFTGNYKADQIHVPAILERLGK